tara:strand:- start:491 stop:685 length:195 start_codon:yes stop_codon:yes gene_type:complete
MKTIRATIQVEVPYTNELMNYGSKLDKELRKVINNTSFINCKLQAGDLKPNGMPTLRNTDETEL